MGQIRQARQQQAQIAPIGKDTHKEYPRQPTVNANTKEFKWYKHGHARTIATCEVPDDQLARGPLCQYVEFLQKLQYVLFILKASNNVLETSLRVQY